MKSQIHKRLALAAVLFSMVFVVTNVTAKPNMPKPNEDPVFTAISEIPKIAEVVSHSADKSGQIVFRHTNLDLSTFEGTWDSGDPCVHDEFLRDERLQGIMVLSPKSRKDPMTAQLLYWFQSGLKSEGDTVTHKFVMEGRFGDLDSWPPSDGETTYLEFNSWEVVAENKWAQRQDCAGGEHGTDYKWEVRVTHEE